MSVAGAYRALGDPTRREIYLFAHAADDVTAEGPGTTRVISLAPYATRGLTKAGG